MLIFFYLLVFKIMSSLVSSNDAQRVLFILVLVLRNMIMLTVGYTVNFFFFSFKFCFQY